MPYLKLISFLFKLKIDENFQIVFQIDIIYEYFIDCCDTRIALILKAFLKSIAIYLKIYCESKLISEKR